MFVRPAEQVTAARGAAVSQVLDVTVLSGFHVNSDKPKDEFLIPLKLTWAPGPLEPQSVTYPHPEEIKVGDQLLTVFTGKFQIQTKFKASANAPSGPGKLTGKLRYQACNNEMCFRPSSADVTLPILIQ